MNKSFENAIRQGFLSAPIKGSVAPLPYEKADQEVDSSPYGFIIAKGVVQQLHGNKSRACRSVRIDPLVLNYGSLKSQGFDCINQLASADLLLFSGQLARKDDLYSSRVEDLLNNIAATYRDSASRKSDGVIGDWVGKSVLRSVLRAQDYRAGQFADSELTAALAKEVEARFVASVADRGYQAQLAGETNVRLVRLNSKKEAEDLDGSFLVVSANELGLSLFKSSAVVAQLVRDFWLNFPSDTLAGAWGQLRKSGDGLVIVPGERKVLQGFGAWE